MKILEEGSKVYLEINIKKELLTLPAKIVSTEMLGTVRIVDAVFDDPNGNPIILNLDYHGVCRSEKPVADPLEGLQPGFNRIQVWG